MRKRHIAALGEGSLKPYQNYAHPGYLNNECPILARYGAIGFADGGINKCYRYAGQREGTLLLSYGEIILTNLLRTRNITENVILFENVHVL